jgi:hypothetical protein
VTGFGVSDERFVQSSSFGPITRDRELISDFFSLTKTTMGFLPTRIHFNEIQLKTRGSIYFNEIT